MCGIVGIVGKSHAEQIIINGLQRLEYRGYDSAGLFVSDEKQEHLVKSQGRIKNLQEKLTNEVNGTIGISIHVGQLMENLQKKMHTRILHKIPISFSP